MQKRRGNTTASNLISTQRWCQVKVRRRTSEDEQFGRRRERAIETVVQLELEALAGAKGIRELAFLWN